jgi:hypothetical protein
MHRTRLVDRTDQGAAHDTKQRQPHRIWISGAIKDCNEIFVREEHLRIAAVRQATERLVLTALRNEGDPTPSIVTEHWRFTRTNDPLRTQPAASSGACRSRAQAHSPTALPEQGCAARRERPHIVNSVLITKRGQRAETQGRQRRG